MTQDLNYYESGYIEVGYYTYTADAESLISSQATISVTPTRIQDTTIAINSSFNQSCVISHIEGADLFAFTEAQLAAQVDRIRDNNINVSSVFSTAIDGTRGIYISAQADAVSLIDVYNTRIRDDEAAIDAAFSISVDASKITAKYGEAALTSIFEQSVIADKLREVYSSLESNFEQTTDSIRIREIESSQSSSFEITTNNNRIVEFSSFENSLFSPSITINPVRNTFAVLDSVASINVNIEIIRDVSSNQSAAFTQTAINDTFRGFNSQLESIYSTNIVADRFANFDISLSSNFEQTSYELVIRETSAAVDFNTSLTIDANQLKSTSVALSSIFSKSAINDRIRGFECANSSNSDLTSSLGIIKEFVVNEISLFSPSITVNPIKNTFAVLDSVTSISVVIAKTTGYQISINSTFSCSIVARKTSIALGNFNTLFSCTPLGYRVRRISASINSLFTEVARPVANKSARGTFNSLFTQTIISYKRFRFTPVSVNSLFTVTANGLQKKGIIKNLQAVSTLGITPTRWSKYWIETTDTAIKNIAIDSSDNVYIVGSTSAGTLGSITKMDPYGRQLWTKTTDLATYTDEIKDLVINGSGNIFAVGSQTHIGAAYKKQPNYISFDSNGNVLYQRSWENTSTAVYPTDYYNYSVKLDIYGNPWVTHTYSGYNTGVGSTRFVFSTGATDYYSGKSYYIHYIDSSNYFYQAQGAGAIKFFHKYSSYDEYTGVWDTRGTQTGYTFLSTNTVVDSSGNVYVVGTRRSGSTPSTYVYTAYVSKLNSSGISQWIKTYSFNGTVSDICLDSNDIPIILTSDLTTNTYITALDPATGNVSWSKVLSNNLATGFNKIQYKNTAIYLNNGSIVIKLPSDGSGYPESEYIYDNTTVTATPITVTWTYNGQWYLLQSRLYPNSYINNSLTITSGSSALTNQIPIVNAGVIVEAFKVGLSSLFVSNIEIGKLQKVTANINAVSSVSASLKANKTITKNLSCISTVTATPKRTRTITKNLQAICTVNVITSDTVRINCQEQAVFNLGISYTRIKDGIIHTDAIAIELTANGRIRNDVAGLEVISSISIVPTVTRTIISNLQSVSTIVAIGNKYRFKEAIVLEVASVSMTTNGGYLQKFTSSQQVNSSLIASGILFKLDPALKYTIPADNRLYTIEFENTNWIIDFEDREKLIEFEDREFIIAEESNTYIL